MSNEDLMSDASTLEEFSKRLDDFRHRLYGKSPRDAESNGYYLAWCDGVQFGRDQTLRLMKHED